MILWDKIEEIKKEYLYQEIEIQLFYNAFKITDWMPLSIFIMNISLDILELPSTKYNIEDTTKETEQIKAPIRYVKVNIKKDS